MKINKLVLEERLKRGFKVGIMLSTVLLVVFFIGSVAFTDLTIVNALIGSVISSLFLGVSIPILVYGIDYISQTLLKNEKQ